MKTGVLVVLGDNVREKFKQLASMGIYTCQLNSWEPENFTDEVAKTIRDAAEEFKITITAFWCGWSGPQVWDFYGGPHTLGLVPVAYRFKRCEELKRGSDFAKKIGVTDIVTHMGFLPENPSTTEYSSLVEAIKDVALYAKNNGQRFLFETGQETPVTLKRTIEDVGTGNLGINLDPANLIMYGKANPIDALDVFGEYVCGVHGKDGMYPTDGHHLGKEVKLGDGKVNYPAFIKALKKVGYDGAITIEREISGEEQIRDIEFAKKYLEELFEAE